MTEVSGVPMPGPRPGPLPAPAAFPRAAPGPRPCEPFYGYGGYGYHYATDNVEYLPYQYSGFPGHGLGYAFD
ncbi:hypothetical protein J6590_071037, partial [Homalodisca vitripennis]